MHSKYKLLFIISSTFLWLPAISQNGFSLIYGNDASETIITQNETIDNTFLFGGNRNIVPNTEQWQGILFEISTDGVVLWENALNLTDTFITISAVIPHNNYYFIVGSLKPVYDKIHNLYFVWKLNSNFEIISKQKYILPENFYFSTAKGFFDSSENLILGGKVQTRTGFPAWFPIFIKISKTGTLLTQKVLTDNQYFLSDIYEIVEKKNSTGYFALTKAFTNQNSGLDGQILSLDQNLELINIHVPHPKLNNVGTLKWLSDTSLIYSGTFDPTNGDPDQIGISITDTLGNESAFLEIGTTTINDIPAMFYNFDFSPDTSSIYICGTHGYQYQNLPSVPSEISLIKTDKELNPIWEKFYGGDAYYVANTMKSTSDGGCIITATRFDFYSHNIENDIFILKVSSDGTITSTNDLPNLKVSELLLYPNPGKEELHLKTAFQKLGGTFVLTDVSGKKVLKKNINQNETTLSTQNLKQGIYFYTYFYKNKPLETGKWVKQ